MDPYNTNTCLYILLFIVISSDVGNMLYRIHYCTVYTCIQSKAIRSYRGTIQVCTVDPQYAKSHSCPKLPYITQKLHPCRHAYTCRSTYLQLHLQPYRLLSHTQKCCALLPINRYIINVHYVPGSPNPWRKTEKSFERFRVPSRRNPAWCSSSS